MRSRSHSLARSNRPLAVITSLSTHVRAWETPVGQVAGVVYRTILRPVWLRWQQPDKVHPMAWTCAGQDFADISLKGKLQEWKGRRLYSTLNLYK